MYLFWGLCNESYSAGIFLVDFGTHKFLGTHKLKKFVELTEKIPAQ